MGGIVSTYTQAKETDFVYDATSGLITERVLRMMYPEEIDANQFPNVQDDGTFMLPPEFSDASLYAAPYLVMQKRRNAVKEFVQRKMKDPQAFWTHFCKTLDIEMNPKPIVVIRVDAEGIIHTDCQNGDAEIRVEFDDSDEESEISEENNIEVPPKKNKKSKESKKDSKEESKKDNEENSGQKSQESLEGELIDDLDDDYESDHQKKKSNKKKLNK